MKTTIQGVLIRLTGEKRGVVEQCMKTFESATRYSYARICDGVPILDIEKDVMDKFSLNSRWSKDAVARAKAAYVGAEKLVEKGKLESPRKLIWGGRRNFERRAKGEISNEEWRRIRSNQFWSRGDKSKNGNLNLRIESAAFFISLSTTA